MHYLSPRRMADAIGVSESSLKRWSDEGRLSVERTAGGHRRISLPEAARFVRESGMRVVRPELLGVAGPARGGRDGAADRLYALLVEDRAAEAIGLIRLWYLEGASIGWICDEPLRGVLARIGELWEHGPGGIVLEHRATETSLRALSELRSLVAPVAEDGPIALGSSGAGDVYQLPSAMAALVLYDAGYQDRNLGADAPAEVVAAAAAHYGPRLIWQSYSAPPADPAAARRGLERIASGAGEAAVVIGGRASATMVPPAHPRVVRLESMTELAAFARGLMQAGTDSAGRGVDAGRESGKIRASA